MNSHPVAAAFVLAIAGCAPVPTATPMNEATTSLAAAESAFAAHSVREGMRAAFLAHFADDGVTVRSGWANSNAYLKDRPDPPIVLDWRPAYVEASASGDLGLSTGPWKLTRKADAAAPAQFGQFVSVWRREGSGPWRVAVDLGIAHPGPDLWDRPLAAGPGSTPRESTGAGTMAAAEAAFDRLSREQGMRAAYEAFGAGDLRFYRIGSRPPQDKAASLAAPGIRPERLAWTVERSELAKAADFGYSRGRYAAAPQGAVLGYFLRVWRREGAAWRVVLDVANPAITPPATN